jgi:hypothetical protein
MVPRKRLVQSQYRARHFVQVKGGFEVLTVALMGRVLDF